MSKVEETTKKVANLTFESGAPVPDNQRTKTAGPMGPAVLDIHFLEKNARFNRERIPERVVHAKGAGAYGTFTCTKDITKYTKAKFLNQVGKKTPIFIRFSTVGGEKGSADTARDPRGFAMKFYTEDGNYDMVANNTPIFFVRDPLKFYDFIHTQKKNPRNNLPMLEGMWDFWSLSPESLHQVTILFSDRGTPDGFRHMHGFGSHTFSMINDKNERTWVKFHFITQQGIKNLMKDQADELAGKDPDYATRDLWEAIEKGNYPKWKAYIQVMPEEQGYKHFGCFDVTKVWSHKEFPLIEFGEFELNKNPTNYFAEVEQAAFAPSHFVPGIGASPDKMLQGRLVSYTDTHYHRLGTNYQQLPINAARCPVRNYHLDGFMQTHVEDKYPNWEPNSYGGPVEVNEEREPKMQVDGDADHYDPRLGTDDDYYKQPGDLFRLMKPNEQQRLCENIALSMLAVPDRIIQRQLPHFYKADEKYGAGVEQQLNKLRKETQMKHADPPRQK